MPSVLRQAPGAAVIVTTNRVDMMTHPAARFAAECGVAPRRVFGWGQLRRGVGAIRGALDELDRSH